MWRWRGGGTGAGRREIDTLCHDSRRDVLRLSLKRRGRKGCICPQAKIHAAHVPIDAFSFFRLGCSLRLWGSDNERFTGASMIKMKLNELDRDLKARGMSQDDIKARVKTRRAELERDVKNRARREFWGKVFKLNTLRHGRSDLDFAGHVRTDGVSISVLFDRLDYRADAQMTTHRRPEETTLTDATPAARATPRRTGAARRRAAPTRRNGPGRARPRREGGLRPIRRAPGSVGASAMLSGRKRPCGMCAIQRPTRP